MFAPKRRQPLAQVLSRYPCAAVAIDGPSPLPAAPIKFAARRAVRQRGFCMLHAILLILLKLRHIFLRDCGDAGTFAVT
jgi:hypothetical protein